MTLDATVEITKLFQHQEANERGEHHSVMCAKEVKCYAHIGK